MAVSLYKWLLPVVLLFSWGKQPNLLPGKHPFYVSVTEINHNAKDKLLEISCKIFTNDLEATLEKSANTKINLSGPDKTNADKFITAYISRHLQLKVDGRPVTLEFVGTENEAEATWTYFQVSNIAAVKRMDIMNNILYESFGSETSIIHVSVNGNRKSTRLNNPDTNVSFEF
jgi:hypothetical protein